MCFLCLRDFPYWPYILKSVAAVLGRPGNKTAFSVASIAGRSIQTTRMWTVRGARSVENSTIRLSFEPNLNFRMETY